MSGSIACPYKILGVSNLAVNDEIEQAFEVYKQAYELLIDGKKRQAYDRQAANEKEKVKNEQLEKELREKNENGDEKLERLRKELGEKGGAGHFWGNDQIIQFGGVRNEMGENELKKVLQLLAAGEKKINLKESEFRDFLSDKKRRETQKKFYNCHNWNVAEAGWTIQFKTALYGKGDGEYFHLWLEQKAGRAKFKATAQQINIVTGEEENRRELQSGRERIKYEEDPHAGNFVRFNITLL